MNFLLSPEFLLRLAKKKLFLFVIPFLLIFAIALLIILRLPAKYESSATILVESQQISQDLIGTNTKSIVDERIKIIQQRVLAREILLKLANKHGVFSNRENLSPTKKVRRMRDNFKIQTISANNGHGARGRDTIAFTISFLDPNAERASTVTNDLVTTFLSEDTEQKTNVAADTTDFMTKQLNRLRVRLEQLDAQVATVKAQNSKSLPEHLDLHLRMLERANADLSKTDAEIALTNQELRFLNLQSRSNASGNLPSEQSEDELKMQSLKEERDELLTVYTDKHPEVKRLNQQIEALQIRLNPKRYLNQLEADISSLKAAIRQAKKENAGETELTALAAEQAALEQGRRDVLNQMRRGTARRDLIENEYNGEVELIRVRLDTLESQRTKIITRIEDYEQRIGKTPNTELLLRDLQRGREALSREYDMITQKLQTAQITEDMVAQNQSEKFTVIENATVPDLPTSPDRPKLGALGFIIAFGSAAALLLGPEILFPKVSTKSQLREYVPMEDIVTIPAYNINKPTLLQNRKLIALLCISGLLTIIVLFAAFKVFV